MREVPPVPAKGEPRSISTGTAARLLGCDASTVRRAITRGELDAYRLGRRGMYRLDPAALHTFKRSAYSPQEPSTG